MTLSYDQFTRRQVQEARSQSCQPPRLKSQYRVYPDQWFKVYLVKQDYPAVVEAPGSKYIHHQVTICQDEKTATCKCKPHLEEDTKLCPHIAEVLAANYWDELKPDQEGGGVRILYFSTGPVIQSFPIASLFDFFIQPNNLDLNGNINNNNSMDDYSNFWWNPASYGGGQSQPSQPQKKQPEMTWEQLLARAKNPELLKELRRRYQSDPNWQRHYGGVVTTMTDETAELHKFEFVQVAPSGEEKDKFYLYLDGEMVGRSINNTSLVTESDEPQPPF